MRERRVNEDHAEIEKWRISSRLVEVAAPASQLREDSIGAFKSLN
jgi:hypothetical protein